MKTLVMTVGTGRNRIDISDALEFSIHQNKPDKVIFLCSGKTAQETYPILQQRLKPLGLPFEHYVVANEDDAVSLYESYWNILKQLDKTEDVIVDFTSGTKAMSAAIFAVGTALQVSRISYVIGPRDETGRVIRSTDIIGLAPSIIYARQNLSRAMDLFDHYEFSAAYRLAEQYAQDHQLPQPLNQLAKELTILCDAYDQWDRFKWDQAAHQLPKAATFKSELSALIDPNRLQSAVQFCQQVSQKPWSSARLYDLVENAQRRFNQGRFDDALARLYRTIEYIIQWRLIEKYQLETKKLPVEKLRQKNVPDTFLKKLKISKNHRTGEDQCELALRSGLELLFLLNDDLGQKFATLYCGEGTFDQAKGVLKGLLDQRNDSWLAHGTVPAKPQTVKELLNICFNLLNELIEPETLKQYQQACLFPKLLAQNRAARHMLQLG